MEVKFIENGHNIILRANDATTRTESVLTHEQFFMLIRDGAKIVQRRLDYEVFSVHEIENILAKIKTAKGREEGI